MAKKPLLQELEELKSDMAQAAQKVYDEWIQDVEGVDEELGTGGICDKVAEEISGVISGIPDAELSSGGADGDDHAWVVVSRGKESYGVDIAPGVYERGGGYCWRKLPNVRFSDEDVQIFEVPYPEENLEMGHSEGGTNIQGNRFEADVSPNQQRADIKDRKNNRLLMLLNREDLEELRAMVSAVLELMPD